MTIELSGSAEESFLLPSGYQFMVAKEQTVMYE